MNSDEKDMMLEKQGREILCLRGMYDDMWEKVYEQNETIVGLKDKHVVELKELYDFDMREMDVLKAELSVRTDDSRVLMAVVEVARIWEEYQYSQSMAQVAGIVKEYLDVPEVPSIAIRPPSIGTRITTKDEKSITIDPHKMEAIQLIIDADDLWVLFTGVDAAEIRKPYITIERLHDAISAKNAVLEHNHKEIERLKFLYDECCCDVGRNEKFIQQDSVEVRQLRFAIDEKDSLLEKQQRINQQNDRIILGLRSVAVDRDKTIDELSGLVCEQDKLVGEGGVTLAAVKYTLELERTNHLVELASVKRILNADRRSKRDEIVRLRRINKTIDDELEALSGLYCAQCDELEKIATLVRRGCGMTYSDLRALIDEIEKIIQEN